MAVLLTGRSNSYAQFITVLIVFVLVLAVTAFVTKWLANYQKQQGINCNIEVLETTRISSNKYIQLVRIGQTYIAIAVCKDTVTTLCEIPKEQLAEAIGSNTSFKELFDKVMKKDSSDMSEPKE
uniref:flagellar biosynthetic protein FliO n=1 Tax=Acetatifactor sp. TaxID=1872090 RepID=UPI004055BE92